MPWTPCSQRLHGELEVEVDVGHQRDLDGLLQRAEVRGGVHVGHGHPDDVRAGGLELPQLVGRALEVAGVGGGHRLHGDGRVAADGTEPSLICRLLRRGVSGCPAVAVGKAHLLAPGPAASSSSTADFSSS